MANGIGRVWAANAGDDEQKPNGVGSVWIENIEALTPSGGASEQQINELSAAIDYVSANAGDPNALTGYQEDDVEISATSSFFGVSGISGLYVISANPGGFKVSGQGYDLIVGSNGHLTANNSCSALFTNGSSAVFTNGSRFINTNSNLISGDGTAGFVASGYYYDLFVGDAGHLSAKNNASAVFTNGSLVSADRNYGFLVSAGNNNFISAVPWGIETRNGSYDIKADNYGLEISASPYINNMPFKYRNYSKNISLADEYGFIFNSSASNISAWIDYCGAFGLSGTMNGGYVGSFGCYQGGTTPIANHSLNGVGFSSNSCDFGVHSNGTLQVCFGGRLSANNSCSTIFTNGSRTEITNGHTLLVGDNEQGTNNGIVVSGNGQEFIKVYNEGNVKVVNGAKIDLSGLTHKIGYSLNASGSQFVSADSEDVSAWAVAPMTVMGVFNQTSSNAAFVIGNGSGTLPSARSDLFVIDYSGNAKSNDFVANNGAKLSDLTGFVPISSYNEVTAKVNELEQVLQTYSGQWLIGG